MAMRATLTLFIAATLALAACGDDEPVSAPPPPDSTVTAPTVTIPPTSTAPPTDPPVASIVEVYEGVNFYPACGNEQLTHGGIAWYQVQRNEYPEIYELVTNGNREDPPESVAVRGFAPRVVAPGPGDDVGTLVVWSDGVAYFVSDSGDLTAWLVDDELTYPWEC